MIEGRKSDQCTVGWPGNRRTSTPRVTRHDDSLSMLERESAPKVITGDGRFRLELLTLSSSCLVESQLNFANKSRIGHVTVTPSMKDQRICLRGGKCRVNHRSTTYSGFRPQASEAQVRALVEFRSYGRLWDQVCLCLYIRHLQSQATTLSSQLGVGVQELCWLRWTVAANTPLLVFVGWMHLRSPSQIPLCCAAFPSLNNPLILQ